jgi:hypothetical protein
MERKGKESLGKQGKERKGKDKNCSLTTKNNQKIQEYHNNHKMKLNFQ